MKIVSLNEKTWDELKTSEKILKESPGCPCVGSPLMDGCGGGSCYTNSCPVNACGNFTDCYSYGGEA
jgi:hypothetical protein